ncbi:MAG: XRE family transcriptional regulator [Phycisphaerae bacterium]|nr:XRE family transcriptional regulator [Phycisphaerae bacterium]MBM91810.1 XRE family transcriptional regulator [Phycisphaerae bacterium]
MEFGQAVRIRRKQAGMSLSDLAERASVSKAMLSDIETGKKNPTLRVACNISVGLDCQISDLLDVPPEVQFEKLDGDRRKVLVDPSCGVERHLLSPPMVQHGIQVLMFVFPPSTEVYWNSDGPGVIEHVTCLEGQIKIVLEQGDESIQLDAMESANFPADADHRFINLENESTTRIMVVVDSSHRGKPAVMRTMNPER